MVKRYLFLFAFLFSIFTSFAQQHYSSVFRLHKGVLNKKNITTRSVKGEEKGVGVLLRSNVESAHMFRNADVEVRLKVPESGWYVLEAETSVVDAEALKRNDQTGRLTLFATFKIGDQRPTKRIVFDNHRGGKQELGKFEINAQESLKIWLPKNLIFYTITLKPYLPPVAPAEAEVYKPSVVPSDVHPRLWMNQETYPIIKSRLNAAEHKQAWKAVCDVAVQPYALDIDADSEMFYDEHLEGIIEKKAFYYLMTKDEKVGKEVVGLTAKYLSALEFGNVSYGDITRELGRAIYTGALVYDWCYELIDTGLKSRFRKDLKRLVRDMEIGWPPFYGLESIINGHGNEAQICRDMLSWSLAIYDEDPEPYKYVSYTILEQLVPMRKFEYQSPRHNQGIDYGGYRFGWEMHAVWLYYRMLGYSVFDDNIKNMSDYWLYMRTPDGKMLRDGDMFNVKYSGSDEFYWKNPQTMLLCYAFSGDRLIKGEFMKQGGLPNNPVLFLMLNDPNLKPDYHLDQLPLTKDFGTVLGAMVARTGWEEVRNSSDVIAEIKGGGYHFGNHQHADAGALQIYHHGNVVGDLGLYLSYGSPYDFNFNKRSVSHSMMLLRDPREPLLFRTKTNDGGTRFSQRFPKTVYEVLNDPWFHTGFVRSSTYGPDALKPKFSYFNVDLSAAYSAKVSAYSKSFLFVNTGLEDVPAFIVLWDDLLAQDSGFENFWQINTLHKPVYKGDDMVLTSSFDGKSGQTYVNMLKPALTDRELTVWSGDSSTFVFGDMYTVKSPWPEAKGSRILISSKEKSAEKEFVTVFQMVEDGRAKLQEKYIDKGHYGYFVIGDKVIVLSKPRQLLNEEIIVQIPADKRYDVIIAGVKEGFWNLYTKGSELSENISVLKDRNVMFFEGKKGELVLKPQRVY
ncbi:hypothetical protein FAZ19_21430 [Sphingobacterium alkalisoli]|uniref:Uncharacterized protein n=1 Tax=Sphingobacterium alkalisoli TaxID=1874115 RepID=A0A4U0GSM4_9SPHI|nr:hypothetical protein [Sphingobacterium alkalisoli]TJY61464.1 hypothetical protein FAZ19_21430 [Sphingobacterium alkalisoli]GGH30247.1 hypothetical protein GCM10011418_42120 [Sphingobacterium alkalisoli]